MTACSATAQI
ncbi:hypothetical protein HaLaN_18279 [Haematococcus lacustris]|uniref:Uncharacterized protein n=1 Tax=Haematococcus lacustris TaxID=44745 RepID=A0A699ZIY2_HAELA|nr:hypothetical protein HaLaN_18279 [Haematococcus lacustris]